MIYHQAIELGAHLMALFHLASVVDAATLCFGADGHVALEDQEVGHQSVGLVTPVAFVDEVTDSEARDHGACLDVVVEAGHDTGSTVKIVPTPAGSVPAADIAIRPNESLVLAYR
jgi:hypothetical protein